MCLTVQRLKWSLLTKKILVTILTEKDFISVLVSRCAVTLRSFKVHSPNRRTDSYTHRLKWIYSLVGEEYPEGHTAEGTQKDDRKEPAHKSPHNAHPLSHTSFGAHIAADMCSRKLSFKWDVPTANDFLLCSASLSFYPRVCFLRLHLFLYSLSLSLSLFLSEC